MATAATGAASTAAPGGVGVGPGASSSLGNAGIGNPAGPGTATSASGAIGGVPAGIATALGVFGGAVTGRALSNGAYKLHGIYFKPSSYPTPADCLTAAYAKGLPLDLCR